MINTAKPLFYSHSHKILEHFNVLKNFPFTTNEIKCGY